MTSTMDVTHPDEQPQLRAPLRNVFDYTRSTGPILGAFFTALRDCRVVGVRGSDGRVHAPPVEYDPSTCEPLTELVDVSDTGVVMSWTWQPAPRQGQPLTTPFAWCLIRLDGADTSMLHAVDVSSPDDVRTGMRVQIRWSDNRIGSIRDIVCFEPQGSSTPAPAPRAPSDAEPVTRIVTPLDVTFDHSASKQESAYLRGLAAGKIIGGRTHAGGKVYVPPRTVSPADGKPTTELVELSDRGTVTTFCIVNVPFLGQRIEPPYIAAYVLLDGADIAFLHLVLECTPDDVHMGMRVEAKWKPAEEWGHTLENIEYFRPSGEPDAAFESFRHHL
ncbi:MAG: Zn-ribbon domain-containing OB-fold protein [Rhodococcus sp. (in: high G+C Gram-positive bacteria)]